MRSVRLQSAGIALLLVAYFSLGSVFRWTRPSGEIFPVSSWTLFLYVPNEVTEYGVEVLSLRGERLGGPLAFHEARGVLPGAGDVSADRVIHRMARAIQRGDAQRLAELRELLERRYLGAAQAPLEYRLVERVYTPLERWRDGSLRRRAVLREFAFGGSTS